jgi:hypothetical protein
MDVERGQENKNNISNQRHGGVRGAVAQWSSHRPYKQTIRVQIPPGIKNQCVGNYNLTCIAREIH